MNLFSKLRDFVSLNEPVYEYGYDDELDTQEYQNIYKEENPQPEIEEVPQPRRRLRDRPDIGMETPTAPGATTPMNNVIGMPGATNSMSEVIVMEPRSFEEMPQAIQALRERKSVVLNLTMMDPDQAQRAVDFVAGGTYAIDGHQERIGESIFLFTPSCVQVKTQIGATQTPPQSQVRPVRPAGGSSPAPAWTDNPAQMA
ncbi:cell division protein SepF [Roseofilum casamattae]|uniref:Cell division protein SepF n=1 Tax=Roseofilum casamattae BLCC-M143 TaxID=3022442 RepID=A0ABT7C317_9CYAN|nr:cell division protein SepF [Roseofilum casamattae]MDJ1185847.1 cell division protein SepF [Roseofilum casamattae BLCC-M143]